MYIVHIASEVAPIAKVGGLADVVYGLARATESAGDTVEVIIPKYDTIDYAALSNLKPIFRELWSYDGPYRYHNTVWSAEVNDLQLLLLEPHHPAYFFSRGKIYGEPDDIDRFIYFCRAALEYLYKSGKQPDIIHLHDWPTALVAPLYKEMYIPLGFRTKTVVLTLHNLEHQGKCAPHNVTRSGLRGDDYLASEKMGDPILPFHLNLLKGGIVYSDRITTVSPTYQKEIQLPPYGFGLETLLSQTHIDGILNGIDTDYWNPATDRYLPVHYTVATVKEGKRHNKLKLQEQLKLEKKEGPIVCAISRLVAQKGPALILYALKRTLEKGGQFILLGSAPDPAIQTAFQQLQTEFLSNRNVAIHLGFDEPLAHITYAGSDMIIVPSLFEPCGLTQMIALRYGTTPIVRKTGGLADTVIDIGQPHGNGVVFETPNTQGIETALERAFEAYRTATLLPCIENGMNTDFSWHRSANAYLELYHESP